MKLKRFQRLGLGKPRQLTEGLTGHEHPSVSPDGKWIAYYAGAYGSIGVVVTTLDGKFARVASPQGGNNTQPSWRPDSGAVAYRHQHDNASKWELWETTLCGTDAETTPRQVLANSQWNYKHPSYSPDGNTVAYFTEEGGKAFHIWLWDRASGERKQVTFGNTQMHCHPVFSPDGTRIAYHAYEGTDENALPGITNLYELDLASSEVRTLTTGSDQYKHPFYIDDDVIVFHHERNTDGTRGLEALHLATLQIVQLTDGSKNDKHPCPFALKGRHYLAWSSKKLGSEPAQTEAEPNHYDIFIAPLTFTAKPSKPKTAKKPKKA